jgi:hypothetical protein
MILGHASTTTQVSTNTSPQSTEGSLSDSGISDSGSEQELSERERRLAALRRLARHLEAVLAPGSEALVNMAKVGARNVLLILSMLSTSYLGCIQLLLLVLIYLVFGRTSKRNSFHCISSENVFASD